MKRKILFVDNEPDSLQLFDEMSAAWDLQRCDSGEEALALLESTAFDIIVSDLCIVGMDGAELLAEVREKYPEMARIVLSAVGGNPADFQSLRLAHQQVAKPYDAETLKSAIQRVFSLKAQLSNQKLIQLISKIKAFPALPATYARITQSLRDPETTIQDVGKIIAEDLGISVKILQLVNSAFYGVARRVSSPEEAAVFLGLNTVRALVLTIGLFDGFEESKVPKQVVEDIYHHSMKTGTLAKAIATKEKLSREQVEDAFMAGLLHDLGKLVMAHNMPQYYGKLLKASQDKKFPIRSAEIEIFGATHEQIGAYLIGLWGLPESIVEAIAYHHDPMQYPTVGFDPLGAVHAADAMAHVDAQAGGDIQENRLSMEYLEHLGLIDHLDDWIDLALESEV